MNLFFFFFFDNKTDKSRRIYLDKIGFGGFFRIRKNDFEDFIILLYREKLV